MRLNIDIIEDQIAGAIMTFFVGVFIAVALILCVLVTPVQTRAQLLINSPDRIENPVNVVKS